MLRTQIYLPEELNYELRLLVTKSQKTMAEVVRELLIEALHIRKKKNAGETLLEIAEINARGPADLSTNLSSYLYGKKSAYGKR